MPSAFDEIRGQPAPLRALRRAIGDGRLASAYLFEGPAGVGKRRAALALAKEAIAPSGSVVARIDAGTHPDVRVFPPRDDGHRNLAVEFVREQVLTVAQFAPFESSHAFLIFPEADVSFPEAHPESANALLKTLEEPRRGVHFVLLAERPDRLLPTIRSRCQRLRFDRLAPAVLEHVLNAHGVPEAARGRAIALADGSAAKALAVVDGGRGDAWLSTALRVDAAVAAARPGALADAADALASHDDLDAVLDALVLVYRDVVRIGLGADDAALTLRDEAAGLRARAANVPPRVAAARAELVFRLRESLEKNVNKGVAADAFVHALAAVV